MHPGPQKGFLPQSSLTLILVVASEISIHASLKKKKKIRNALNSQELKLLLNGGQSSCQF